MYSNNNFEKGDLSVKIRTLSLNRWQRATIVLLIGGCIALLGGFYATLVKRNVGIPCLFHMVTRLRCPGCGISRALAALLQGQFDAFFRYNLLSPLIVLYLAYVSILTARNYISNGKVAYRSPNKWIDIGMLAIVLLWWIVRNLLYL